MEEIGKAAFQLDLKSLKAMRPTNESISGALLSACFAHEPDPKVQEKVISYLLDSGADVMKSIINWVTALHRAVRFRGPTAAKLPRRFIGQLPIPGRRLPKGKPRKWNDWFKSYWPAGLKSG